ncbi:glyoxalase [Arenicella chitinivorans]|uniref:Glyoxalase n=1 Tax=Arenicella chitinivorans TaxID=1329800 RepID=A0A918RXB1_9GAMM|nr:VOC family protein [Arenicella chitinivorans]GHA14537.1 glyoxalase [Arenicella chitinivorans]
MNKHEKLNYLELPARDLASTKTFFTNVFGWRFTDYGAEYTAFDNQGLEGGFYQADLVSRSDLGAALAVFYSTDLEQTLAKVEAAGGTVIKPIFAFPGGRRFHFTEPSGSEFAVWSEPAAN